MDLVVLAGSSAWRLRADTSWTSGGAARPSQGCAEAPSVLQLSQVIRWVVCKEKAPRGQKAKYECRSTTPNHLQVPLARELLCESGGRKEILVTDQQGKHRVR